MLNTAQTSKITLRLQVLTDGEWGTVNTLSEHFTKRDELTAQLRKMMERWQRCGYFGGASMRIVG